MERHTQRVAELIETYRLSAAALELYDTFWSEVCDWYLELVKPRLYEGDPEASAVLLHVLGRCLEMLHPFMPHVTEEIWSFMPGDRGLLAIAPWPDSDQSLLDPEAEATMARVQDAVSVIRRLRDEAGIKPGVRLPAQVELDQDVAAHIANLARLELSSNGADPVASVAGGAITILASQDFDAEAFTRSIESRRGHLRDEVARAEKKLGNKGFVDKAPAEVVQEERQKVERLRRELESLGE
jgi:valyl-tRNA synthetase